MFPIAPLAYLVQSAQTDRTEADQTKAGRAQEAARLLDRAGRLLQGGQLTETKASRRTGLALESELRDFRATGFALESARPVNPLWATGFLQAQYLNSDAENGPNDAFRIRRARLNGNVLIDAKTMGRGSVEFASGSNQTTAQVRDAFIQYRPGTFLRLDGPAFTLGQMNTPLGYDISLPSWARTWPERSQYEQALFSGERGRGFLAQVGSVDNYVYAGVFNALTVNDPEQASLPAGQGDKVGPIAGVRFQRGALNGGVSGFATRRPRYVNNGVASPEGDRSFAYADLRYAPLNSRWDVRAEAMVGNDRVPSAAASATNRSRPLFGAHLQVDREINAKDRLMFRAETFDRDRHESGDSLNLVGFGYVRDETANLRLTGAIEFAHDGRRTTGQKDYTVLTLRAQLRF